jgi:hypothetical protein
MVYDPDDGSGELHVAVVTEDVVLTGTDAHRITGVVMVLVV